MINEPIYVGFSLLNLNKLLLHEPVNNYIKRKLIANLLFTDTESLVYEISANDVYEDSYWEMYLFDFSDYPQDSKFFDHVNKEVIGKKRKTNSKENWLVKLLD